MPDASPLAQICPRCRTPLSRETGGICLVCLGAEVLDTEDSPAAANGPDSVELKEQALARIGAYTIVEEIGRGGMGVVYAARHERLGRIVALKTISGGRFATIEQQTRFVREAQTAARLRHPHIVPVHDADVVDGLAFFTMDLVTDGDLAARLRAQPLAPRAAAVLLHKVATAIAHAHAEGVLHRDLKPSNILLDGDEPRVADFGLAAQLEPGGDLTAITRVLGTPAYLAPEIQLRGSGAASPASDVYALGAILYECLTGRPPFFGLTDLAAIGTAEPVAPRSLAPSCPRDLETIALKCLEKNAAARYASAAALAEDFARLIDNRPILARPVSPPARFVRWCRRRPALAAVWFLVVALAAGATTAAVLIAGARTETRSQLAAAQLAEARAHTLTRRMGRRADALAALAAAARVQPSLELRNTAIVALALPDVAIARRWPIQGSSLPIALFDPTGAGFILMLDPKRLSWRETGTDHEWMRFDAQTVVPASLPGFSPDGRRVVMRGSDNVVYVWRRDDNAASRQPAAALWSLPDRPHPWPRPSIAYGADVTFSPDGRRVTAAAKEGGFSVHDAGDGRELARWPHEFLPNRIRWSPDGQRIAVASSLKAAAGRLHFVDAATLTTLRTVEAGSNIFDFAWDLSGEIVAVSTEANEVRMFRADDGELLRTLHTGQRRVSMLGFLAETGDLLTTVGTESTLIWRARDSGEEVLTIPNVQLSVFTLAADGASFFTTDGKSQGLHFNVLAPAGLRTFPVDPDTAVTSHGGSGSLSFSADGSLLCTTGAGRVTLTRVADGARLARLKSAPHEYVTAVLARDARSVYVCGTADGFSHVAIHERDGRTEFGERVVIDATPDTYLRDISDDGTKLVTVSPRKALVKIFALDAKGTPMQAAEWSIPGPYGAAFGRGGTQLLINHDDTLPNFPGATLRVWDVATGQPAHTLDAPISADVDWNGRAEVAITSNGRNESFLWHTDTWRRGAALPEGVRGNFTCFAIAPDGKLVAIGTGDGVHLIEFASGRTLAVLSRGGAFGYANAVSFAPDGATIAAVNGDGLVHLWHLPTLRTELAKLRLDW